MKGRKKVTMSNQPENENQQSQTVTPQELREFLLAELEASKQAIAELSDEQMEIITGGALHHEEAQMQGIIHDELNALDFHPAPSPPRYYNSPPHSDVSQHSAPPSPDTDRVWISFSRSLSRTRSAPESFAYLDRISHFWGGHH
jgi:hypothetical protein